MGWQCCRTDEIRKSPTKESNSCKEKTRGDRIRGIGLSTLSLGGRVPGCQRGGSNNIKETLDSTPGRYRGTECRNSTRTATPREKK